MSPVICGMLTNKTLFLRSRKVEKKHKRSFTDLLKNGAAGTGRRKSDASSKSLGDVLVARTGRWLNSKRASMEKAVWQYVLYICAKKCCCLTGSQASTGPSLSLQMQSKMMVYDQSISELNNTRLRGTSFPILHSLIQASRRVNTDVSALSIVYVLCSQFLVIAAISTNDIKF